MPLKLRECHLSRQQAVRLAMLANDLRDWDGTVLKSTAPGNALVEADPSEPGALDPLLDALATRGFSPITCNPSLRALEAAYPLTSARSTQGFVERSMLPRSFAVWRSVEEDGGMTGPTLIRQPNRDQSDVAEHVI